MIVEIIIIKNMFFYKNKILMIKKKIIPRTKLTQIKKHNQNKARKMLKIIMKCIQSIKELHIFNNLL